MSERGPYKLVRRLGRGGMGTVWVAKGPGGAQVALKTVNGADARLLRRFRHEIRTLRRLEHPGVARLLDDGVGEDGLPWYTMELLRGRPLSEYMRRAADLARRMAAQPSSDSPPTRIVDGGTRDHWTSQLGGLDVSSADLSALARAATQTATALAATSSAREAAGDARAPRQAERASRAWPPPNVEALLGLIGQLCATLTYVHGEGIAHCDIKPENVVVTEAGRAVLVDFGIAGSFGERVEPEVVEAAGEKAGTAQYISPEQIRGDWVDARADLYAVGCLIYEALTGAPPFVAEQVDEVIRGHLEVVPRAPSRWVRDLPLELDVLCARLLEKEPTRRLGHAAAVSRGLARLGIAPRPWEGAPPARAYLYKPELAGRGALIDELARALERARAGHGASWALGGEAGVGKSRVAAELIARTRRGGGAALSGQCTEEDDEQAPGALDGFIPMLRQIADACVQGGLEQTRHLLGRAGKILEPYAPFLADLPGQRALEPPPELAPEQARRRVYGALEYTLRQLSGGDPLTLVLDDVHLADALTLGAIGWLSERAQARGWLVLLLYSPDEASEELKALLAGSVGRVERLGRLERGAAHKLLAQMLGLLEPPAELADYVLGQTEGNPFYVAQYLRAALDEGLLRQEDDGSWQLDRAPGRRVHEDLEGMEVPGAIRALVVRRIARLDDDARAALEAAAVLGRRPPRSVIADVSGLARPRLRAALAELASLEVLEEDREDPSRSRFVHDTLREGALSMLDAQTQRGLHARAAAALGSRGAPSAVVARHLELSGDPVAARVRWRAAADVAVAATAPRAEALERLVALTAPPEQVRLRLELAEALAAMSKWAAAREQLEQVVREARRHELPEARAWALTLLGDVCRNMGDARRARRLLGEASARYEAMASGHGQADVEINLGRLELHEGDLDAARGHCARALELYQRVGDARGEAFALMQLGDATLRAGRVNESESYLERAARRHAGLGDARGVARARTQLAWLALSRGKLARAKRLCAEAREALDELEDPAGLGLAALVGAEVALEEGLRDAIAMARRAHELLTLAADAHHATRAAAVLAAAWAPERPDLSGRWYARALAADGRHLDARCRELLERARSARAE